MSDSEQRITDWAELLDRARAFAQAYQEALKTAGGASDTNAHFAALKAAELAFRSVYGSG